MCVCVCGCSFVGSCQFTKNIASMGSLFACASLSKGNALKKYSWTELNPNLPQLQVNAQWFDTRLFKYDNCVIFCSILQLVHNPQPIKNQVSISSCIWSYAASIHRVKSSNHAIALLEGMEYAGSAASFLRNCSTGADQGVTSACQESKLKT